MRGRSAAVFLFNWFLAFYKDEHIYFLVNMILLSLNLLHPRLPRGFNPTN